MKIKFLACLFSTLILMFFSSLIVLANPSINDDILATINGENIYKKDFNRLYNAHKKQFHISYNFDLFTKNPKAQVKREEQLSQAKENGLSVTFEELNIAVDKLINQFGTIESIENKAKENNLSLQDIKNKLSENLLLDKYFEATIKDKLTDKMVNELLVLQEAKLRNISIPNEETVKRVNLLKEKQGGEAGFKKFLAENNATIDDVNNEIKNQLLLELTKEAILKETKDFKAYINKKKLASNITDSQLSILNPQSSTLNPQPSIQPSLRTNTYPTLTRKKAQEIRHLESNTTQLLSQVENKIKGLNQNKEETLHATSQSTSPAQQGEARQRRQSSNQQSALNTELETIAKKIQPTTPVKLPTQGQQNLDSSNAQIETIKAALNDLDELEKKYIKEQKEALLVEKQKMKLQNTQNAINIDTLKEPIVLKPIEDKRLKPRSKDLDNKKQEKELQRKKQKEERLAKSEQERLAKEETKKQETEKQKELKIAKEELAKQKNLEKTKKQEELKIIEEARLVKLEQERLAKIELEKIKEQEQAKKQEELRLAKEESAKQKELEEKRTEEARLAKLEQEKLVKAELEKQKVLEEAKRQEELRLAKEASLKQKELEKAKKNRDVAGNVSTTTNPPSKKGGSESSTEQQPIATNPQSTIHSPSFSIPNSQFSIPPQSSMSYSVNINDLNIFKTGNLNLQNIPSSENRTKTLEELRRRIDERRLTIKK